MPFSWLLAIAVAVGVGGVQDQAGCPAEPENHDYCVIGAGPGGLQFGALLQSEGRDYVVLEQNSGPGSFFERFPRHRQLISINKPNTGYGDPGFNERHDWNSLLSFKAETKRFPAFSGDFWPHADDLVRYLRHYAESEEIGIRYDTTVGQIRRRQRRRRSDEVQKGTTTAGFEVEASGATCSRGYKHLYTIGCGVVVMATGLHPRQMTDVPGIELAEGYETMSADPQNFTNQTVLVLGAGNAAFETASAVHRYAAHVSIQSRNDRLRLAWETHYPGDLRTTNNEVLEAYMLKSLDIYTALPSLDWHLMPGNKTDGAPCIMVGGDPIKEFNEPNELTPGFGAMDDAAKARARRFTEIARAILEEDKSLKMCFDRVVRCLGWEFDNSTIEVERDSTGKFPRITAAHESASEPGVYFVGALGHSLDYRQSSGGFIHGFRYTARAAYRSIRERQHAEEWPHAVLGNIDVALPTKMIKRINSMAGPYQMFGYLYDVFVVFSDRSAKHYEEVPQPGLKAFLRNRKKFSAEGVTVAAVYTVGFVYGEASSAPGRDVFGPRRLVHPDYLGPSGPGVDQNFIHPLIEFYDKPLDKQRPKGASAMHHMAEEDSTLWNKPVAHVAPLFEFIEETAVFLPPQPLPDEEELARLGEEELRLIIKGSGYSADDCGTVAELAERAVEALLEKYRVAQSRAEARRKLRNTDMAAQQEAAQAKEKFLKATEAKIKSLEKTDAENTAAYDEAESKAASAKERINANRAKLKKVKKMEEGMAAGVEGMDPAALHELFGDEGLAMLQRANGGFASDDDDDYDDIVDVADEIPKKKKKKKKTKKKAKKAKKSKKSVAKNKKRRQLLHKEAGQSAAGE